MTSGQFDGWKIVLTDFGMSVIYNQTADAMVLAGARLGGIHTPPPHSLIIFKMVDVQWGMPLRRALAETW